MIESTAAEYTLKADEIVRRARDLATTLATALDEQQALFRAGTRQSAHIFVFRHLFGIVR